MQAAEVPARPLDLVVQRDIPTIQAAEVPARPLDLVVQREMTTMPVHINVME
jgi:hypothetical protein